MQNIGEELVGDYLKWCRGCEFVGFNSATKDVQGEIDVIGLNLDKGEVYVCEVAIHLITGLQYVNSKTKRPENVSRLTAKFSKGCEYVKKYFPKYEAKVMLWSPIVKNQRATSKTNQMRDIREIASNIQTKYGLQIEMVINEKFQEYFEELRKVARRETQELKSPALRMLQIEEKLRKHLSKRP